MAKDDDDEVGPSLAAIRAKLKKWPWGGGSKSKEEGDDSSAPSSSSGKSPGGLYAAPPWLPLPKIAMAAFGLNLLFLMIGLIVAGLVLGGTITINAKAIGLTESLVLISSIFGLAYMAVHMLAARRPDPVEGLTSKKRTSRHTRIIMLGRITTGLWAVSLLAVAITLASLPADSQSSRSPLQAGLAACIMDCLDMTAVLLIVERTTQPFVLPWLTPPIPEAQTLAAKALIDGILGDGISGHPYAGSEAATATEADTTAMATDSRSSSDAGEEPPVAVVPPKRRMRVTIQDVPDGEDDDPTVSTSTLGGETFGQPSAATLVERQELWSRVDEGNSAKAASSIKLPPHPSTFLPPNMQQQQHQIQPVPPIPPQHMYGMPPSAAFMQPMPSPFQYYPPQPTYLPPMHMQTAPYPPTPPAAPPAAVPARPPLSRAAGSGVPRYSYQPALSTVPSTVPSPAPAASFGVGGIGSGGPRPLYETGRMSSYTTYMSSMAGGSSSGTRSDGAQSVPPPTGPLGARPPPPPPVKGKRLFDKAVQGLKANEKRNEPVWDDYSTIHVPGSFV
ncbi:hypothetical protein SCUCBS95973_002975 [Sporothrix curviconia]|uniref:Uncharacterized protein n=1 Tax=Sporothrix curviconia TaxID=1260050 RepID=A0ABP0BBK6_9PEZI